MILSVTPNTGLDTSYILPHFRWGETIRSSAAAEGMGGKGLAASWVLGELGIATTAMGFAAGQTGERIARMLNARGVRTAFTQVQGESRRNTIVVDGETKQHTTLISNGLRVDDQQIDQLVGAFQTMLPQASSVVLGGSLPDGAPEDFYRQLIVPARKAGVPVVLDSSGPALLAGLKAEPTLIKPNQEELEFMANRKLSGIRVVVDAAQQLNRQYGCSVVVTLGAQGALAITGKANFFINPVRVNVVSAAGAGDAVTAGVAHSLAERQPLAEGLRLGFAAAASVITTLGTGDCRRDDVHAYRSRVMIRELDETTGPLEKLIGY